MKIVPNFAALRAVMMLVVFIVSSAFFVVNSQSKSQVPAYTLADVQKVYPDARSFTLGQNNEIVVSNRKKAVIGYLLASTDFGISYTGYSGDVSVLVAFDQKRIITGVYVFKHNEDKAYINDVIFEGLLDRWNKKALTPEVSKQNVDAVSGATFSSNAIINTVRHTMAAYLKTEIPAPVSRNLLETANAESANAGTKPVYENKMKKSIGPRAAIMPKPALVIGSYDSNGVPNIMTAGWAGIANSNPLSVAVSIRPACKTHDNIMATRFFTINVPSTKYAAHMDYVGVVSGHNENKFETLGLTAVKGEFVNAPYVGEFPVVLECEVTHTINLGSHIQFIGKVIDTKVDVDLLDDKNRIDALKMQPVIFDESGYFSFGEYLGRPGNLHKTLLGEKNKGESTQNKAKQSVSTAPEQNATLETIFNRKSVRRYTDKAVSKEQLKLLVRAGMAAPTARNRQPWAFVVVTDRAVLDQLAEELPYAKMLKNASAAIAVCGDMTKAFEGDARMYWVQDCSAATQNILLAAESMGLGAVWTGVHPIAEREKSVVKVLQLPSHIVPLNVIVIGYPQGDEEPKDKWNEELIRWEKW